VRDVVVAMGYATQRIGNYIEICRPNRGIAETVAGPFVYYICVKYIASHQRWLLLFSPTPLAAWPEPAYTSKYAPHVSTAETQRKQRTKQQAFAHEYVYY
jgi:hypothetical protein